MATTYVVLEMGSNPDGAVEPMEMFAVSASGVEAANAEQACRKVAETLDDDELAEGVTLIAVPLRNWTTGRNTFKAETRRRLLKS